MTKKQVHLELESLISFIAGNKCVINTVDLPTALLDLRILINSVLHDLESTKRELTYEKARNKD